MGRRYFVSVLGGSTIDVARGCREFEYEFTRVPVGSEALGATHGSELPYVFGTLDRGIGSRGPPPRVTAVDTQVSEVMQQYWTNFAKTGNPNGVGLPEWPRYDTEHAILHLDKTITAGPDANRAKYQYLSTAEAGLLVREPPR